MSRAIRFAVLLGCLVSCTDKTGEGTKAPQPDPSFAFENPGGMWMPAQMPAHADTLKKLGVAFEPEVLADPTAFPLGAVVSLGGCSASFVSDKGLVITNHHCVTGALQYNSTPQENLLDNGFLAKSQAQERWAGPQARIYVTTAFNDVTDQVLPGLADIEDPGARYEELDKRTHRIEAECRQRHPNTRCRVASYFEGAQFFAIQQLEIRDVRLVYAPHAGVGVFGGEVDNWRWPRHTGDYSFLRAYVGKDGKPAEFAEGNVAYAPPHHLQVATTALQPGDFAMVAGYPGRTYRLKTADEVEAAVQWDYPRRIARSNRHVEVLEALTGPRPDLQILAASKLRRLHNARTNYQGMLDGLTKGGLLGKKRDLETTLTRWIEANPARKEKYGTVLAEMAAAAEEARKHRDHDAAVDELLKASDLFKVALGVWEYALRRGAEQPDPDGRDKAIRDAKALTRSFSPVLDQALLSAAIEGAAALPDGQRPDDLLAAILGDASLAGDVAKRDQALVDLYAGTKLVTEDARVKLLQSATVKNLKSSRDTFLRLAREADRLTAAVRQRERRYEGAMAALRPLYLAALREFADGPLAPDANGTLRLTFGTVRGYRPSKGADVYTPFTTVTEMVAKNTGKEPFAVPANVLAAAQKGKEGYIDETLGDIPLDFLADLDITGGNSGSATLNARGELIGLAFDGNYESIASDWVFTPSVSRSIHVDIRYILWLMDRVDSADHLMREMGVEPKD